MLGQRIELAQAIRDPHQNSLVRLAVLRGCHGLECHWGSLHSHNVKWPFCRWFPFAASFREPMPIGNIPDRGERS
jgi:hypothetical protein